MITIFSLSSDTGDKSTSKSDRTIVKIYQFITNKKLSDSEKQVVIDKYVTPVRKGAHFIIYLILGVLVISLIKEYKLLDIKSLLIALIFCFLYACSDEIHQLFVIGRSGEILDVLLDTIGGSCSSYLYFLFKSKK